MRYRTKAVEIDAIRYTGDNLAEIQTFLGPHAKAEQVKLPANRRGITDGLIIRTVDQRLPVPVGYWIVRDEDDVLDLRTSTSFAAAYEPAEERGEPDATAYQWSVGSPDGFVSTNSYTEAGARRRAAELGAQVVYRVVGEWQPADDQPRN